MRIWRINVKLLKRDAEARGLSGSELAASAGLGEATVYRCFAGKSISSKSLRKIATALGHEMERYLK